MNWSLTLNRRFVFLGLAFFIASQANASNRAFEAIDIPGAVCGDGSPYHVLFAPGDPSKIVFNFEGGGACWDALTCHGPIPVTSLKITNRFFMRGGLISTDPAISPVTDWTMVYLPYCTGDVHVGKHVARYLGRKVRHVGGLNFPRALKTLLTQKRIDVSAARELLVYGQSAGGIGAAYHAAQLAPYLNPSQRKTFIMDSSGMHFPNNFWHRFPKDMLKDFREALADFGVTLDINDGMLAKHAKDVCGHFPDWKIGVLQGSYDLMMSIIFGNIPPTLHDKWVYARDGLYQQTLDPHDNCSAWVPRHYRHTYLTDDWSTKVRAGGVSAKQYIQDLLDGFGGLTYRSY